MIDKKVFEFIEYKAYLDHIEQVKRQFTKGFRSRLAEEVGCNNAFISQVLNTSANFSLEQSLRVCSYLNLNAEEERYFLLLVEFARAGTSQLKDHFKKIITEMKEKHLDIKGRVKQETVLTLESQTTYYSQWYYSAIHMIVTIPEFKTVSKIAKALGLKNKTVEKAVLFLLSVQLIIEKSGEFFPGPSYLHLSKGSPNITKHHTNWRMAAINSLQDEGKVDIHYSTVSTLSLKDVEVLRARFVEYIQDYVHLLDKSKEEEMYCFNLDFFSLINE